MLSSTAFVRRLNAAIEQPLLCIGHCTNYLSLMTTHSSIISEFASLEEAEAYEEWLKAKFAASLADECSSVAHDVVMAEMKAIIEEARQRQRA